MDDLSLEAIECTKPDGGVVSSTDRKAVIALLMLSEDELDLRVRRWISTDAWELWRVGMTTHLRRWPFDVVWDEVRHVEGDAADGQFSQLRDASSQVGVVGFDPAPASKEMPWQGRSCRGGIQSDVECRERVDPPALTRAKLAPVPAVTLFDTAPGGRGVSLRSAASSWERPQQWSVMTVVGAIALPATALRVMAIAAVVAGAVSISHWVPLSSEAF